MTVTVQLEEADRFLRLLDPTATVFTFQTFQDLASGIKAKRHDLARVLNCAVRDPLLLDLYKHGSGVWVTVNRTDLRGRNSKDVDRIRCIWQEDDDSYAGSFPIAPSIVVESSPGRFHRYWLTDCPVTEATRLEHRAVMERMVASHGSDKSATDICRVLRVPGFLHRKAEPFVVRIVDASGHRYPWAEILSAFPAIPRAAPKPAAAWQPRDGDYARIASALAAIPADDRDDWLVIGAILKDHLGAAGRALWDHWSQGSSKYDADDQERVWRSIGTSTKRAGLATLFHHALRHGWKPPPLTEAEKKPWRAAGYFLWLLAPASARRTFQHWCQHYCRPPLPPAEAERIFQTLLEKES